MAQFHDFINNIFQVMPCNALYIEAIKQSWSVMPYDALGI